MTGYGYTLVQHTAYVVGGDLSFRRGLEPRPLATQRDRDRVLGAGGLVFPTYKDAEDAGEVYMYPEGYTGFIPTCGGSFSRVEIDSCPVYVPKTEGGSGEHQPSVPFGT